MKKKSKNYLPIVKLWDGTTVHSSLDTATMAHVAELLRELGFTAFHKFWWSFEDLQNGKLAYVTHTRRLATINPYTVSQRDAEKFMIQMYRGALPDNVAMAVAAHGHTTRGSIDDDPFYMVNAPCWTSFIEYPQATANFAHWQPDIGATFIIVTKEGRIRTQKWLYKPFVYDYISETIYEGQHSKCIDISKEIKIEPYFLEMCKEAKLIIAVTADFHIGEKASVCPEKLKDPNGMERLIPQSLANKRILEYWKHFVDTCKIIQPDELWVVGDAVAGTNLFEKTRRLTLGNIDDQKYAFVELFKGFLED